MASSKDDTPHKRETRYVSKQAECQQDAYSFSSAVKTISFGELVLEQLYPFGSHVTISKQFLRCKLPMFNSFTIPKEILLCRSTHHKHKYVTPTIRNPHKTKNHQSLSTRKNPTYTHHQHLSTKTNNTHQPPLKPHTYIHIYTRNETPHTHTQMQHTRAYTLTPIHEHTHGLAHATQITPLTLSQVPINPSHTPLTLPQMQTQPNSQHAHSHIATHEYQS